MRREKEERLKKKVEDRRGKEGKEGIKGKGKKTFQLVLHKAQKDTVLFFMSFVSFSFETMILRVRTMTSVGFWSTDVHLPTWQVQLTHCFGSAVMKGGEAQRREEQREYLVKG